jgi:hypothetical protein
MYPPIIIAIPPARDNISVSVYSGLELEASIHKTTFLWLTSAVKLENCTQ